MKKIVYSPKCKVFIDTYDSGTIDVSKDVINGSVNLVIGNSNTCSVTLANTKKRYTQKVKLRRHDRILIYLSRSSSESYLVFSGYITSVPEIVMFNSNITITARSSSKKYANTYVDEGNQNILDMMTATGEGQDAGTGECIVKLICGPGNGKQSDIIIKDLPKNYVAEITNYLIDINDKKESAGQEDIAKFYNLLTGGGIWNESINDELISENTDISSLYAQMIQQSPDNIAYAEDVWNNFWKWKNSNEDKWGKPKERLQNIYSQQTAVRRHVLMDAIDDNPSEDPYNTVKNVRVYIDFDENYDKVGPNNKHLAKKDNDNLSIHISLRGLFNVLINDRTKFYVEDSNDVDREAYALHDFEITGASLGSAESAMMALITGDIDWAKSPLISKTGEEATEAKKIMVDAMRIRDSFHLDENGEKQAGSQGKLKVEAAIEYFERAMEEKWKYTQNSNAASGPVRTQDGYGDCSSTVYRAIKYATLYEGGGFFTGTEITLLPSNGWTQKGDDEPHQRGDIFVISESSNASGGNYSHTGMFWDENTIIHMTCRDPSAKSGTSPGVQKDRWDPYYAYLKGKMPYCWYFRSDQADESGWFNSLGANKDIFNPNSKAEATIADVNKLIFNALYVGWTPNSTEESYQLVGKRALMNDVPLLGIIVKLIESSQRSWMDLPDGRMLAFYEDFFGDHLLSVQNRNYNVEINGDDIINFTVQKSDDPIATHAYFTANIFSAGGVKDITVDNLIMKLNSSVVSLEDPSICALLGAQFSENSTDPDTNPGLFLQRYGSRPINDSSDIIASAEMQMMSAINLFRTKWGQQSKTDVQVSFLPFILPGMRLKVADSNTAASVYVNSVSHSFGYEQPFTTSLQVSCPTPPIG